FIQAEDGIRYRNVTGVQTCALPILGNYGNSTAEEFELSREAQDEWSYRSHQRAIKAIEDGKFAEEIVSVEVPQRKGDTIVVDTDEAPRKDTSVEKLTSLKHEFDRDG